MAFYISPLRHAKRATSPAGGGFLKALPPGELPQSG